MKRDMNLVREILIRVEAQSADQEGAPLNVGDHSDAEVGYHVKIMHQARLVEVIGGATDLESWIPLALTWQGHDFLDACREPTRWESAIRLVREKAGAVSFEVLKQLLVALSKRSLGL
ncbi:hypothetical protein RAS1_08600 [Phycisphaerae bacterium RAS1]|nr:hypothetical protein RAS1_08600 [Phycisphaerae bacterium RAS1]